MLYHLLVQHTTSYQMNIQKRVHSSLCLEEMQFYLSINYYNHKCDTSGNDENILSMQALKNIYEMVAQNLKLAHPKITDNINPIPTKLKEGDLVLIKDHTTKAFQPHYVGNYRIVSFKGNQVEVRKTEGGNTTWVHLTDVKYILPVDNVINKLPDYQSFGRKTKLRLNPDRIPDLHWNLSTTLNTTPTLTTQKSLIQANITSV